MKFSNFDAPRPDELLFSYFLRTLRKNGWDIKLFETLIMGNQHFQRLSAFELRREFLPFCRMLPPNSEAECGDLFLSLSTYRFESLFLMPEEQMAYINEVFREPDGLNMITNYLLKRIRICPICAEEDTNLFGDAYFHRMHQIPGLCICPKHHTHLCTYRVDHSNIEAWQLTDFQIDETEIPEADLIAYADYTFQIFQSRVSSDLSVLATVIRKKLFDLDYLSRPSMPTFYADLNSWEHKALCKINSPFFSAWLTRIRTKSPPDILGLLMFLFPSPQDLIDTIDSANPLLESYTCSSCGCVYYGTPYSHNIGWGCPECNKKLTYTERYIHLVHTLGDGEYDVRAPFTSLSTRTKLFHKVCGRERNIKPNMFLYYGERCRCEITHSEQAIRAFVDEYGFDLLSYDRAGKRMVVSHRKCGTSFAAGDPFFLSHPVCQVCAQRQAIINREKSCLKRISDLVGDEYTLRAIADQGKNLKLRHNTCGMEIEMGTNLFFIGYRCPQCTPMPPLSEMGKALAAASNGKYILSEGANALTVVVLNTEAGEKKTYKKELLRQELTRPTPSDVFPGMQTGHHFPGWEDYLHAYIEYRKKTGASPPKGYVYGSLALGAWNKNMKRLRTKGLLSEERIQTLTDAGFDWEPKIKQK